MVGLGTQDSLGEAEDFVEDFRECGVWRRHEGVRIAAWVEDSLKLFVDGEQVPAMIPTNALSIPEGFEVVLESNIQSPEEPNLQNPEGQ